MIKKNHMTIILGLLMMFSCQQNNVKTENLKIEDKMILKCIIFPTGMSSEVYLIKIFEDGKMDITFGEKNIKEDGDDFSKIVAAKSIILNEDNFKTIKMLHVELLKLDSISNKNVKKGGWEVVLTAGNKKFHFYYGEMSTTVIGRIINEIIKISPLKVDLHSWS